MRFNEKGLQQAYAAIESKHNVKMVEKDYFTDFYRTFYFKYTTEDQEIHPGYLTYYDMSEGFGYRIHDMKAERPLTAPLEKKLLKG